MPITRKKNKMEFLIGAAVAVIVIAAGGLFKIKVLDRIKENAQDVEDLTVLISDMSGKDE